MIISDLNYLEATNEEIFGGGGPFSFTKTVSSTVNNEFNFDANIDIDKTKNVDVDINADIDVEGNIAELIFDAEAVGKNSIVEVETSVLAVEDKLSSVAGSILAGVG